MKVKMYSVQLNIYQGLLISINKNQEDGYLGVKYSRVMQFEEKELTKRRNNCMLLSVAAQSLGQLRMPYFILQLDSREERASDTRQYFPVWPVYPHWFYLDLIAFQFILTDSILGINVSTLEHFFSQITFFLIKLESFDQIAKN